MLYKTHNFACECYYRTPSAFFSTIITKNNIYILKYLKKKYFSVIGEISFHRNVCIKNVDN